MCDDDFPRTTPCTTCGMGPPGSDEDDGISPCEDCCCDHIEWWARKATDAAADREREIVTMLAGEFGEAEMGPTESLDDVVRHIRSIGPTMVRHCEVVAKLQDERDELDRALINVCEKLAECEGELMAAQAKADVAMLAHAEREGMLLATIGKLHDDIAALVPAQRKADAAMWAHAEAVSVGDTPDDCHDEDIVGCLRILYPDDAERLIAAMGSESDG